MKRDRLLIAVAGVGLVIAVALVVAVLLAAPGGDRQPASGPPPGPYRGSEPPGQLAASDFRLRSYRGRIVSLRAQRGKVVLLSFVDTKCTEKCPIVTSVIAQAYRLLRPDERRQVVPLLISVEPHADTPAHVRRFLARRHALALDYLIGTVRRLRPVWKAYGIVAAVDTGNADIHSSDVRVIDRRGIWVATQHAGVDLTPSNLAHDALEALKRS
ncbi:MAG TPA: SCO family protein [Gemmatimonadales bacterium]|nr:SCO family protein [Gemmatimonadales bacterium]